MTKYKFEIKDYGSPEFNSALISCTKVARSIREWLSKSWWKYLLHKPFSFRSFWCRKNGHKCGPVWYNLEGIEPDMHCRNCGDDIG